jgi:hypothetical protein
MELPVILGGREIIGRYRPILYYESSLCDEEQKEAAQRIEELLRGLGYRLFKILDSRGTIQETRYPDYSPETLALPDNRFAG